MIAASFVVPTLVAAAFIVFELSRPHQLFGVFAADDGVYYGAADRLVHGVVPYRDFALVHPPGIALVLAPIAALGRAIGSRDGLALARVLTALVSVANVTLVCSILRHRGAFASFVGGLVLACFPVAIAATHTVLLEPYVVFFSVVGVALGFPNGALTRRPLRAVLAGVAAGFAVVVKIDAAIVLVAIVAVAAGREVAGAARIAIGAAAVVVASSLAFVALAPGAFFRDVVVAQLSRGTTARATPGLGLRFLDLTGLKGVTAAHVSLVAAEAVAAFVAAALFVYVVVARRHLDDVARFAVASFVVVSLVELATPAFYTYYSYLPAALFATVAGSVAGDVAMLVKRVPRAIRALAPSLVVVTVGVAAFVADQQATFVTSYLAGDRPSDVAAVVDAKVPPGACVVFDEAVLAVASNRFDATRIDCPALDDPFGAWLAADPAHPPPDRSPPASLVREWRSWLARADYFIESAPNSAFVPWTSSLSTYFARHFRLVASTRRALVYENTVRARPRRASRGRH